MHTKIASARSRAARLSANELNQLLNLLLTLDQTVVELSMQIYDLPQPHRLAMREQNRRLHDAVREGLPAVLSKRARMKKSQASVR